MRAISSLILACLVIAVLAGNVTAKPPAGELDFAAVDAYIQGQMNKHGLPGISLAVVQGDQIAYLKGYGTDGHNRPMTPQTPMYIGSQSKSITGLAIAQLAEEGKISLKDPIQKYLPWFQVADPQASAKITVGDMAHHLSGLSDAGYLVTLPDSATLEEGVRSLASAKLTAPTGSKQQYFNMGYAVLALIVQQVSGQPYEEYIQQHIFAPLEMTHSTTDPGMAREDGLSQGHSRFFGFSVPWPQSHPTYAIGDGYIISTAEDLAHYAIAIMNDGSYQGGRVLTPENVSLLFTAEKGYGLGWFVTTSKIWHGGANETFKTFMNLYPGKKIAIVLLINQGYMLDHYISAEQVFQGVEALVLGNSPPAISQGGSTRIIGWGILALVLALCVLHTFNFIHLRGWRERAAKMSTGKKIFEVAISFIIPTVILIVIYTQVKGFLGDRFNLTYQMVWMVRGLPDIFILMVVGSLPDYIQGIIKLVWAVRGKRAGKRLDQASHAI
jgi:CubicO group peptidase (beta-lactamase class C family)